MVDVSYTFGASDTIAYAAVNQNFSDITAALSQLRSSNLASDAGILSTQMASRYHVFSLDIALVPIDTGTSIVAAGTAGNQFSVPAAVSDVLKRKFSFKSGQEAWITVIEAYVAARTADTGADVALQVKKGSTILGGASVTLSGSDNYYKVANTNPLDNPLISLQDLDELIFQLGSSTGANTPRVRGLSVRVDIKVEHTS